MAVFAAAAGVAALAIGSLAAAGRLGTGPADDPPAEPSAAAPTVQAGTLSTDGVGPIEVGMTPEELENLDGAVVEKYRNRREWCYGEFSYGDVTGIISWFQDVVTGARYEKHGVTEITVQGAARTPEGIGVGSTLDELRAVYPDVELDGARATVQLNGAHPIFLEFAGVSRGSDAEDEVSAISLDVGQMCVD